MYSTKEVNMNSINVTDLRKHLPEYMNRVKAGEEVTVTWRGRAIARIVPVLDESEEAREWLNKIRKTSWVGDVVSPSGEDWEAESDNP
jgi:prevent-host-death family protein